MKLSRKKRYKEYDNNIHTLRISLGYSIDDISKNINMHVVTVSNIASGYYSPFFTCGRTKPWVEKLCKLFSKEMIDIWPLDVCNIIKREKVFRGEINFEDFTYDQLAPEFCSSFTLGKDEQVINKIMVKKYMEHLNEREKEIILRHICYDETLESIGEDLHMTKQAIKQICDRGMKKVKRVFQKINEGL